LFTIPGLDARLATSIVSRALQWPDAFLASDPALQRAAGASSERGLLEKAERWRPWRAYAALHLWTSLPTVSPRAEVRANDRPAA
jgi:AraC family transcriptional regulator, regulatory protein of adaptative response / DNA-3-methyladenine glycosylase II